MVAVITKTALERFAALTEVKGECIVWTGCHTWSGYGHFRPGGHGNQRPVMAHRWVYEFFIEPIPKGMVIDHLCRVRDCVHLDHLEMVTQGENLRRGYAARKAEANA